MWKINRKIILILAILSTLLWVTLRRSTQPKSTVFPPITSTAVRANSTPALFPSATRSPIPTQKIIPNDYHIFQTFNNCGPASLSMMLSYFDIEVSQAELGEALRPYQNPQGDNDDKNVDMDELVEKGKEYHLIGIHRPNGNPMVLKQFIAHDLPVLTRTLLHISDDIGHYRVIKGYDDATQEFIQDDSFQGKNLRYSYADFNQLWEKYQYEYVVFVPIDKESVVKTILGEDFDEQIAWKNTANRLSQEIQNDPENSTNIFNLSVANYRLHDFQGSVQEFEKVQSNLSFRALWYQIEPIKAYFELGNYEQVLSLTDGILTNHNRAASELYVLRGKVFLKQRNQEAAKQEFEKAVFYNKHLKAAQEAVNSLK